MSRMAVLALVASLLAQAGVATAPARAADLYRPDRWSALAADRSAARVGDSLTVVIDESSFASNSIQNGTSKASRLGGRAAAGSYDKSAALELNNSFQGSGQTGAARKILAQISVVVDAVLPNGDLHVIGAQLVDINGERSTITVRGRIRPADIAGDNSVLSTRLSDAVIEYGGAGFMARGARPGFFSRLLNRVGLP